MISPVFEIPFLLFDDDLSIPRLLYDPFIHYETLFKKENTHF